MTTGNPTRERKPEPEPKTDVYDDVVENSFPASDPPPGVIKVGPRKKRLGPRSVPTKPPAH